MISSVPPFPTFKINDNGSDFTDTDIREEIKIFSMTGQEKSLVDLKLIRNLVDMGSKFF